MPTCLFCSNGDATNEHVISQWISQQVHKISPFTPEHGAPAIREPGATRFYMSRVIAVRIRAACQTCNSVFFNELEEPCRPFLARALAGEGSPLDLETKRSVATWAYKTALLIALHGISRQQWPAPILRQCRELHTRRLPPVGSRIWVGRYDMAGSFPDRVHRELVSELRVRRRGVEHPGYQIVWTVCNLLCIVVFWDTMAPDSFEIDAARLNPDAVTLIWPARLQQEVWPPRQTVFASTFETFANWGP